MQKNNIHTAIDTAGSVELEMAKDVINLSDMLLLDIKDLDEHDSFKLKWRFTSKKFANFKLL